MSKLSDIMQETNLKLATVSSVWNYHHSGTFTELLNNKSSNLHNDVKKLEKSAGLTIFTGCIGRSGHSKTDILVFFGESNNDSYYGAYYSKEELSNIFK